MNWKKGDDVIVHPTVSNEEAKTLFPEHTVHKASVNGLQSFISGIAADYSLSALPQDHTPQGLKFANYRLGLCSYHGVDAGMRSVRLFDYAYVTVSINVKNVVTISILSGS